MLIRQTSGLADDGGTVAWRMRVVNGADDSLRGVALSVNMRETVTPWKYAIVFVDETPIGGVVQSSRAGHLKAFRRDQEIVPQTNGSCAASTALPPLAFHVKHREQGECCTWCQCRGVGRASLTGARRRMSMIFAAAAF